MAIEEPLRRILSRNVLTHSMIHSSVKVPKLFDFQNISIPMHVVPSWRRNNDIFGKLKIRKQANEYCKQMYLRIV
jgi:hypothetical protein